MELIFLVILTAFIIYKLLQKLGKAKKNLKVFTLIDPVLKTFKKYIDRVKNAEFEITSIKNSNFDPKIKKILERIIASDNAFNINNFFNNVKKAFKIILIALNKNETEILKKLLEKKRYESFIREISNRKEKKIHYAVALISIKSIKIINASMQNNFISIQLDIHSEQIIQIKDNKKNTVVGNSNRILQIFDVWIFSKKNQSQDTWLLTSTHSRKVNNT